MLEAAAAPMWLLPRERGANRRAQRCSPAIEPCCCHMHIPLFMPIWLMRRLILHTCMVLVDRLAPCDKTILLQGRHHSKLGAAALWGYGGRCTAGEPYHGARPGARPVRGVRED